MLIKRPSDIKPSEITPESIYKERRKFIGQGLGLAALAQTHMLLPGMAHADYLYDVPSNIKGPSWLEAKLPDMKTGRYSTAEKKTPYFDITTYNNFYEFGAAKEMPSRRAKQFKTDPWSVEVSGEANKVGTFALEDIIRPHALEERIYRLRCVEAWSMVIPWVGVPLRDILKRFEPNSRAKYVEFTTLYDPEQMPGQKSATSTIDWPYVEALRIDEAMNPLTLMAVGLYGRAIPPQNGAPMRLVVPWKYGFKSIKSIVKIRFTETMPVNSWQQIAPDEYGFYANVNPEVDHPRWSQAREKRLPSSFLKPNYRETEMFNGYADQVAYLYMGMDLKRWY